MLFKKIKITIVILLINTIFFCFGTIVKSENNFEFFMNDFFNKKNKALKLLKEVELNLKNGSKDVSCSKQREAVRIAILANESLIKAYKTNGSQPPLDTIESYKARWNSILENCEEGN